VIGRTLLAALLGCEQLMPVAASPVQTGSAANQRELIAVTSKDGTRIAVECAGTGRPTLLFVHGGVGDRTRWTPMLPLLASKFTACAMDRRGHGASGDSPEYSLSKEAEDVAAVVNSRAGPVFVFGHSYGGVAALEAAFLTDRIAKLMLYEPPLHEPIANNLAVAARVEEIVRKGELEQALVAFQTEIVKQSPEEIARMKARPTWAPVGNFVWPGFSLHEELEWLVKAGLTPIEALQAATLNPAQFLGREKELGTVERGKLADLVLLDDNPLEDIRNTQRIAAVMANGRYMDKTELQKMLWELEVAANRK
jgi:pimeloyl-ACP methyl ester carboxylesterase